MATRAFVFLTLVKLLVFLPSALSQSTTAPAPGPDGSINITAILVSGGQFSAFLLLLNQTRVLDQLPNQINNSNQGMTLFAPTDNAFLNLPSGTLNNLSEEKKVKLVLYHVLPKFYTMEDLDTVSNPVPTQAGGDHGSLGLNFSGRANQVNVSTGVVETQINNALRKDFPFAVYVVDKVLIPLEFTEAPGPKGSSSPSEGKPANAPSSPAADADGSSPAENGGGRRVDVGMGLVGGFVLFCMAFL